MKIEKFNEMNNHGNHRIRVRLVDICDSERPEYGLHDGWNFIEDKECNFDAEKGFIDHECIIHRDSDNKFFKFTYTQFAYHGTDLLEQVAEEVFRRAITTYEYY